MDFGKDCRLFSLNVLFYNSLALLLYFLAERFGLRLWWYFNLFQLWFCYRCRFLCQLGLRNCWHSHLQLLCRNTGVAYQIDLSGAFLSNLFLWSLLFNRSITNGQDLNIFVFWYWLHNQLYFFFCLLVLFQLYFLNFKRCQRCRNRDKFFRCSIKLWVKLFLNLFI